MVAGDGDLPGARLSKQAFYAWCTSPLSQRGFGDAHLIDAALAIHTGDPGYGYRFIADERPAHGSSAGENRVAPLCPSMRIWSTHSTKRGRPGRPVHDAPVTRDFTADTPNTLWLTDITEHHTDEAKLYLCAIKDVHSNRIVGSSLDSRMTADLAVVALQNAVSLRESPVGVVVHSDRVHGWRPVPIHRLRQRRSSRTQLRLAIITWIETSHHRRRRQRRQRCQRRLGRLTPVEFETIYKTAHAA